MYIFISALVNLFHDKLKPEFYMTLALLALQQWIIWLKSNLSLAPLYWYVVAYEIWRNTIMGHMGV